MTHTGCQDGAKIRQLREARGHTLAQFAARIGIVPQSLSNIELGNKGASTIVLVRIAQELRVPLDVIVARQAAA